MANGDTEETTRNRLRRKDRKKDGKRLVQQKKHKQGKQREEGHQTGRAQ